MVKSVAQSSTAKRAKTAPNDVGLAARSLAAALICLTFFLALKLALTVLRGTSRIVARLPGADRALRNPLTCSVTAAGVALLLACPLGETLVQQSSAWLVMHCGAFAVATAIFAWCGSRALETPASLEAISLGIPSDPFQAWFALRLRNPLDSIWIKLAAVMTILMAPAVAGLLLPGFITGHTAILFGVAVATCWDTAEAFEHADSHYHFLRKPAVRSACEQLVLATLSLHLRYGFTLMLGRIPEWYAVQHVVVHHAEDNDVDDTQSTLAYDRASFVDFARCANKFALSGILPLDVAGYLVRRRRWGALRRLVRGVAIFYGFVGIVALCNWPAAATILAVRYGALLHSAMGFFQEHGMVDIAAPRNPYRNALHYLAAGNTHCSLGDDAHIEHHLRQARHWSLYPADAKRNEDRYAAEQSLGFRQLADSQRVYYAALWRGDFVGLAKLFVIFGEPGATPDRIAALLVERTRPLRRRHHSLLMGLFDQALGRAAACILP